MSDIVIVSAARTPVGSFNGAFAGLPAHELGRIAISAAISRAGIAAADVDEVIMGQVLQAGAGQGPARQASVNAGVPVESPAWSVNQLCAPWPSPRSRSPPATPPSWWPAARRA
jgi:acetyl-CoA C-acetyltransferase